MSDGETASGSGADGPDRMSGVLENIAKRITTIGSVVAAIIALNTLVSGCSRDNIERYTTFRTAVEGEEKFWNGLYDQYLATFEPRTEGGDTGADDARRSAKRRAIQALTNHTVPDFREHQLGVFRNSYAAQDQASRNIAAIKAGLVDALTRSDDPAIARSSQEAIFTSGENDIPGLLKKKQTDGGTSEKSVTTTRTVLTDAIISYQSQTLTLGAPKGWDIDVFWCAGADEPVRYGNASAIAARLAKSAGSPGSRLFGSDLLLGRVRLRSLPQSRQGRGYPSAGREILVDDTAAEQAAGSKLATFLNADQKTPFVLRRSDVGSAWYLSVFVCG